MNSVLSPQSLLSFQYAKKEHLAELLQLMLECSQSIGLPFELVHRQSNLQEFLSDSNLGGIWLIQYEQEVIGYIVLCYGFSFEYHGRDAFIDEFFIQEKFRHQGFGKKVLEFIKKEAFYLGIKALHLEVDLENVAGNMLYHQSGFKESTRKLMSFVIE